MMLVKRLFSMLSLAGLLGLAACGGGGGNAGTTNFGNGSGGGTGGGTGSATVSDLDIQLSSSTVPNSGASTVTATVTALDANRNAVSNAAVVVSANSGAVLTVTGTLGSVTDASGRIIANVGIGSNHTNRDITITASAGSVTRTAVLKVVDSPAGNAPTSIELIASSTTVGTGGDGVLIRAFVKDSNNNALPSATVSFRTSTGTLTGATATTDAAGIASATLSAGADKSNRTAVVTVSSGTVSNSISLPITGTRLTLSGPSSLILGSAAAFDVVVTDSAGNVVPGVAVSGTSSLGNAVVAVGGNTTNANGQVRFNYTATNSGTDNLVFSGAGATASPTPALVISGQDFAFISPAASATVPVNTPQAVQVRLRVGLVGQADVTINFAATGGTLSAATAVTNAAGIATVNISSASAGPVTVQATVAGSATTTTLPLQIVATTPSRLVLQVSPTALAPNLSAASGNQAQVVAKVTDTAGNPVQGLVVNFSRETDPSGGNLLQASATTDSSGQASVAYRSGAQSTANNGVVLRATVATAPAVTATATLTVNQTALFIALGTGNVIDNLDPQTYKKDWVVYVTDSNGIPVNGVTLTIKAIPTFYRTGRLAFNGTVWAYVAPIYECRNEDANANGILDLSSGPATAVATGTTTTFTALNTLAVGNRVQLSGFTGAGAGSINGQTFAVTAATGTTFTIAVNTSGQTINAPGNFSGGEDDNGDGVLWPGNVIGVSPGTVQTANGRATVSLTYAESYAPWIRLRLTASATVSGTESRTDVEFIVQGSGPDFSNETVPPAGVTSPYGLLPKAGAVCTPIL